MRKQVIGGHFYDKARRNNPVVQTLRNRFLATLIDLRPACLDDFRLNVDPRHWAVSLNLVEDPSGEPCPWAILFAEENIRVLTCSRHAYTDAPRYLSHSHTGSFENVRIDQTFTFDPNLESMQEARKRMLAAIIENLDVQLANAVREFKQQCNTAIPVKDFETEAFGWAVSYQCLCIEVADIAWSPEHRRTVQSAIHDVLKTRGIRRRASKRPSR